MFLSSQELRQIKHDYHKLLNSPEACSIVLFYRRTQGEHIDDTPVEHPTRAIHKTVTPLDLQKMKDRVLEVGESLFFISSSINLSMPNGADAVVDGTLQVVDSSGNKWNPRVVDGGDASRYVTYFLGSEQIGQVIICQKEK